MVANKHRFGSRKPRKTKFPENWSDDKIIQEVNRIANDPSTTSGSGKWDSSYRIETVDGIELRVDFYPSSNPDYAGKVSTAYPTNVTTNPI